MSIALFDEPYRVTINTPNAANGSRAGMLMGLRIVENTMVGVLLLEDGSLAQVETIFFTVDFRYDPTSGHFVDVDALKDDQEG